VRNVGYRFVPVKAERADQAGDEQARSAREAGTARRAGALGRAGVRAATPAR
jgi:hypothetical protein